MHYKANWSDLEDNMKFKRHQEKERLYEFLAGVNKELDEVHGQILGQRPLPPIGEAFAKVRREASKHRVILGAKKDSHEIFVNERSIDNSAFVTKRSVSQPIRDQKSNLHP